MAANPMALAVYKRERWCIVAKLTTFTGDRQPILAVAWRRQRGTEKAISLPVAVIEYAKQRGVTRFFLRDDRRMSMLTCDLAAFERGSLRSDGERYVPLSWLQSVPWREWAFAKTTLRLAQPEPLAKPTQLSLFGEVA